MKRFAVLLVLTVSVVAVTSAAVGHASPNRSASGHELWLSTYAGPDQRGDLGETVLRSPDGSRVFVSGESNGDSVVIAYDAVTGRQLWVKIATFDSDTISGLSLALSPDGTKVYVSGLGAHLAYVTAAYDAASGATLWISHYHDSCPNFNVPTALAVSPDGTRLFVTGSSGWFGGVRPHSGESSGCGTKFQTVAYDTATGAREWARFHDGLNGINNIQAKVTVSPDGTRVFVTGDREARLDDYWDTATFAYDAQTGTLLWQRRAPWAYRTAAPVASPDGTKVFISGDTNRLGNIGSVTVAYDASSGATLWEQRHRTPSLPPSLLQQLAVSPDGGKLVVLQKRGLVAGGALSAYDTGTGTRLWINHQTINRYVGAVAFAQDGNQVYLAGQIWPATPTQADDMFTIADDAATGSRSQETRYATPANVGGGSFALSPDATRLYATGALINPSDPSNYDLATIAFQAN